MDNTAVLISIARKRIHGYILNRLRDNGVDGMATSHGDIIRRLLRQNSMTMGELSFELGKDPSTITTLIKKLVDFGYVRIEKDLRDRRATRVMLTKKGEALKPVYEKISAELYDKIYQGIKDDERKEFRRVLMKIIDNMNK